MQRLTPPFIRKLHGFAIAILMSSLAACGNDPAVADSAETASTGAAQSASTPPAEPARVEPTEAEMRALAQAEIDEMNRKGGFVIQMSGAQSDPIKIRLESFRKIGCKAYTRACRCESEVRFSYPGTDFPAETLPKSERYEKDGQGRWIATG